MSKIIDSKENIRAKDNSLSYKQLGLTELQKFVNFSTTEFAYCLDSKTYIDISIGCCKYEDTIFFIIGNKNDTKFGSIYIFNDVEFSQHKFEGEEDLFTDNTHREESMDTDVNSMFFNCSENNINKNFNNNNCDNIIEEFKEKLNIDNKNCNSNKFISTEYIKQILGDKTNESLSYFISLVISKLKYDLKIFENNYKLKKIIISYSVLLNKKNLIGHILNIDLNNLEIKQFVKNLIDVLKNIIFVEN